MLLPLDKVAQMNYTCRVDNDKHKDENFFMLYRKVDTNLNFANREKEVETFWAQHDIAQKVIDNRDGCEGYTFYDDSSTANGQPHIGHGLPVEPEVEKLIAVNSEQIYRETAARILQDFARRDRRKRVENF